MKKKIIKYTIISLFLVLFISISFGCEKYKYKLGPDSITSATVKNIEIKYLQEKNNFKVTNIKPLTNNRNLYFDVEAPLSNVVSIEYNKDNFTFKIIFDKEKLITKSTGKAFIYNDSEKTNQISEFNITLTKNTDLLTEEIASLSEKLRGVDTISDEKASPDNLRVYKKFITTSNHIKIKTSISQAQKVFLDKTSTQDEINEQYNILKEINDNFSKNIIIGTKTPEYSKKGSILAISIYVFFVATSLTALLAIFFVKKKKNNENKK